MSFVWLPVRESTRRWSRYHCSFWVPVGWWPCRALLEGYEESGVLWGGMTLSAHVLSCFPRHFRAQGMQLGVSKSWLYAG